MAPSRILIVRTSAMGDVVHTLPLATALRRRRPEARIGWVVESAWAPLLAEHNAVDDVIEVRLKTWRKRPLSRETRRQFREFLARLDGFEADVAIDAMGNHKGALIAALSRAGRVIGARREDRREPSSAVWAGESIPVRGTHVVERQRSLAAAVDADDGVIDFDGDSILPRSQAASVPPVLIQPSAGWPSKEYPPERWAAVAAALAPDFPVGILVAPGEGALAESIAEQAGAGTTTVDALNLPALAAALRGAKLILGGDTGPVHLAHALGTPAICLLGPTDPERNGLWGAPDRNLSHRLPCSFCYQRFDEAKACLLEIAPEEIVARASSHFRAAAR